MKSLTLSLALLAVVALPLSVPAPPIPWGPLTIRLKATLQEQVAVTSTRTNISSAGTNRLETFTATSTNLVVDNAFVLKMLEQMFATNFPAGAELMIDPCSRVAVVQGGTNVLMNLPDSPAPVGFDLNSPLESGRWIRTSDVPSGAWRKDSYNTTLKFGGSFAVNNYIQMYYFSLSGTCIQQQTGNDPGVGRTTWTMTGSGPAYFNYMPGIVTGTVKATAPGICVPR
ncbi:MAG: hypothetical protein U1F98_14155 [Verrucomicrobiota bacterium]